MGKKAQLSIADQTTNGTTARSRRARLTPEEQREIARVYTDENASPAELRTRFGIGDSSLYRLLQKQGVDPARTLGFRAPSSKGRLLGPWVR